MKRLNSNSRTIIKLKLIMLVAAAQAANTRDTSMPPRRPQCLRQGIKNDKNLLKRFNYK
jgi:hypothetical protein